MFILSACRPIVHSVCLFYIFLLLFSNKMKSSFLFYGDMKQFFTTHTDKYRMNDVIIIYRIGPLYILNSVNTIFEFVFIVMNLSIISPQKTADNTQF